MKLSKPLSELLFPGLVSNEQYRRLIDISSIRSDKVIRALRDYFVHGLSRNDVCIKNDVNPGYLSIKIREVQLLYKRIIDIYPYFQY